MSALEELVKYRERRRRLELSSREHPDARKVEAAVDKMLAKARRGGGTGFDKRLFEFEREVEEISDAIRSLLVSTGAAEDDRAAGLRICRKLYEFASETMADSYMPLYLYLLYRYAQALLDAGQPEAALERFQALYDGTERLIGVNNSYGISCLERVAAAAGQAGQKTVAAAAMEAMRRTAREAFEENSAMALAVERIVKA
jgi:hypothetical protein